VSESLEDKAKFDAEMILALESYFSSRPEFSGSSELGFMGGYRMGCASSQPKQPRDPKITSEYDPDMSIIEIFVDGEEVCAWFCDDEPGQSEAEFLKIFNLGRNYDKPKQPSDEEIIKEVSQQARDTLDSSFIDLPIKYRNNVLTLIGVSVSAALDKRGK
jgi:hypothetical protein